MALSNKERAARWRARQKADTEKMRRYKLNERERYLKKKEKGIVKPIADMSQREKRNVRRRWRRNQRSKRYRDGALQTHMNNMPTPPVSPENDRKKQDAREISMKKLGRKKVSKSRSSAYRQIFKLKVQLNAQAKLKERYKKRNQRLIKRFGFNQVKLQENRIIDSHISRKALLLFDAISKNVRERYQKTKSYKERQLISSLVCRHKIVKKYRLIGYASGVLGMSRYRVKKTPSDTTPRMQIRKTRMKKNVMTFLERDDNSRMKADKKATITRSGDKKQIRLLCDDLKHLHAKFLLEGPTKISYSLFCRLKPFWILRPTARDRDTCLCKIHDNLRMKIEKGYMENMYTTTNIDDLIKSITCNDASKECMYRECQTCKESSVPTMIYEEGKMTKWNMWQNQRVNKSKKTEEGEVSYTVSVTVKHEEEGTLRTLANDINIELQRACRHVFNIRNQYSSIRRLRENLQDNELLVHIDFSENYNCKYHAEIQSMHFGASQRQISLHTGMAYSKSKSYPFCTISDCLKHGPAAIWAHLDPILTYLQKECDARVIHFLSDGPTTQYRNKQNFYLFSTQVFRHKFQRGTWNFLEAAHGKGAADGIGAAVKRRADKLVHTLSQDIMCAEDMLQKFSTLETEVKLFLVKEDDVSTIEASLPLELRPVSKTMKIHQV